MPLLSYTGGFTENRDNRDPHSWKHVYQPLVDIRTLLNTTGLDYQNVQQYGLRPDRTMMRDELKDGVVRVSGGAATAIPAGSLVHFVYPITDPDGSGLVIGCVLALSYAPSTTNHYADAYVPEAIAAGASGLAYRTYYEESAFDTTGSSVYADVYLSDDTEGGSDVSAPAAGKCVQIVGEVMIPIGDPGRIIYRLPGIIVPHTLVAEV